MSKTDALEKGKGFLVAAKRCDQCLYSKGKIVSDARREDVLEECRRTGKYFLCHKSTMNSGAVVCRGFFDTERNQACQVAYRLGLVVLVDPAAGEKPTANEKGAPVTAPLSGPMKKRRTRARKFSRSEQ